MEAEYRPATTLRADTISRSFEGIVALQDVTIEIGRHEVVGLIGPNGAGKSTLVNVMTGFDQPTVGTVMLEGIDITACPLIAGDEPDSPGPFSTPGRSQACRFARTSK